MISRSLWVISRTVTPSRPSRAGCRTAGRSLPASARPSARPRIRIRAPRISALRISTRCCSPTGRRRPPRRAARRARSSRSSRISSARVAARPGASSAPPSRAQHDVLQHREVRHQHEVLVHHADAVPDGVGRAGDGHRPAVDLDLALVGRVEAVEDRDQRRLAGAVLADDAVDRARHDLDVDRVVRLHRAETFRDAAQPDGRGGAAGAGCPSPFGGEGRDGDVRQARAALSTGSSGRPRSCGRRCRPR